ncbi:Dabb family protein [Paraburkholderia fungorum]|uniref:Dabb family protein n=1 Tax=Paraburkholderia fungorum TaxID=134537 RepID=UPI0038B901B6
MIRHIVMWRVGGDTPDEKLAARQLVKQSFEQLRGRIPGMRHLEVGIDSSAVDYACDVVLVTEFASQEALDAYASHPEHLRVRQALGNIRTARYQVDYAVTEPAARTSEDCHANA